MLDLSYKRKPFITTVKDGSIFKKNIFKTTT